MMKKTIFSLLTVLILLIGCRYEEGPGISFHSPNFRLVGTWQLMHTYLNGEEVTSVSYQANKPGSYYYIYSDGVLSVVTYYNSVTHYSNYGNWQFTDGEKSLALEFSLIGKKYVYTADIKKLSLKELIYEYTDADNNRWRLEMNSRSH